MSDSALKHVLVTGACGRLGRVVVEHLLAAGYAVRATDLSVRTELPVPLEVADLTHREVCYGLCLGMDALVHLGNIPSAGSIDDQSLLRNNGLSNFNLFQAAAERGVGKIVFASSIQAIGGKGWIERDQENHVPFTLPLSERTPALPGNSYAFSKQAGEEALRYFAKNHGLSSIALRFPHIRRSSHHSHSRPRRRTRHKADFVAWLWAGDAASLIEACLRTELPGYRVYLPSSTQLPGNAGLREFFDTWYRGAELEKPLDELDALVDIETITRETGWLPAREDDPLGER